MLRDQLFDRVYAVRVRAFARNYRNAELDMHFSLAQDLTPLKVFLASARERACTAWQWILSAACFRAGL